MNTQYRKNLKAVAQACKDYTDEKIKKVYYDIGHNDISTDDHTDEASYQITAPANAKLLMLQAIGGNTVKYNPSVASDSTKALIKTMPSTVYTFDGSKFEGDSEVSENLIVLQDVAETTVGTLTYSISNGVLTLNGTGNGSNMTNILNVVNSQIATMDTSNYTLKWFTNLTSFGSLGGFVGFNNYYENYFKLADGETANTNGSKFGTKIQINSSSTFNNVKLMPMLVKGTTAPTEFKQGFEGIRSAKTTSVKFEGANLIGLQDVAQTTTNGITYSVKDGVITLNGTTSVNYWAINLSIPTIYAGTYYGTTFATSNPPNSAVYLGTTQSIYGNITTTTSYTNIRIYIHNINTVVNNWVIKPMLVRGSNAPTSFVPYVAPTIKTIDLSTILYNGSPLFEDNCLKGVGTAKDYITPYLAHKEIGSRAYQSGDEEDTSVLTDGTTTLYPLATPIEVSIDWSSTLRGIQGYPNGSIIAENTNNMDVESVITYNSIIQETLCPSVTITRNGVDILTRNLPTQASDGWSAGTSRNYRVFCDDEGNEVSKRETNVDKSAIL